MQRAFRVVVAVAALGAVGAFSPLAAQEGPETVTLDASRTGVVTFPHWAHQQGTECSDCHHPAPEGVTMESEQQACRGCHTDAPEAPVMTPRSEIFHADRAASGVCVDCHVTAAESGTEVPERCRDCHVRDRGQERPLPALLAWFMDR